MKNRYSGKKLSELPCNHAHRREIATQEKLAAMIEKRKHLEYMETFWTGKLTETQARLTETRDNLATARKQETSLREHMSIAAKQDRDERKQELQNRKQELQNVVNRLRAELEEDEL